MRTIARYWCILLVVLALSLTGHQAAVARGASHGVDTVVICIGLTVVEVQIDADGQPVETHHLCPDAALSLIAATAVGDSLNQPAPVWRTVDHLRQIRLMAHALPGKPRARSPPVSTAL